MKVEFLKNLLLEEIRLHSELRGTRNFFLYPVIILIASTIVTYILYNYSTIGNISKISILIFFIFGIVSGTFGLNASNYLERRFGDYGKLFSNAQLLPIKLSNIFIMTAISDSIFYLGWFIFPMFGGGTIALLLSNSSVALIPKLLLASILSFILGIGFSFFLTVILTKSLIVFFLFLILSIIDLVKYPPYIMYENIWFIILYFILTILLFLLTAFAIGNEYNSIRRKGKYKSFKFRSINHFIFKDMIDLFRTHGIFAKPLFNVLIPSVLLIALIGNLNILDFVSTNLVFISILLGTLSVNFFNIILSGDSFAYYVFLPASLKDFVKPKIILTEIICFLQGSVLIIVYAYMNSTYDFLFSSIVTLSAFIYYTICLNFWINGLKPNENSMNITSLGWMTVLYLPILILGMVIPFVTNSFIILFVFCLILVFLGSLFYEIGIRKWE